MENEEIFDNFINKPIFNENGEIDPVSLNELKNAIESIGPAYTRLSNKPEWSEKRWTFLTEILGSFAKVSIGLSPYTIPNNLEKVILYLDACLKKSYKWEIVEGKFWAKISLCDINKMLHEILENFNLVQEWNQKKKNAEYNFNDPDTDFIDLYALFHNVCLEIRKDRIEFDRFNKEFEEKYGHLNEE